MYISRRALRHQFDPRNYPQHTYLLCKLEWGRSGNFWRHWVRNEKGCHVEKYFLQEIFEPRSHNFCNITWYLSWSPCPDCCDIIQDFLEEHPNVYIDIRVARLHYSDCSRNQTGLMQLHSLHRANIQVMEEEDYYYCWETFIPRDVNYDFMAVNYRPEIRRNRLMLEDILRGLHL